MPRIDDSFNPHVEMSRIDREQREHKEKLEERAREQERKRKNACAIATKLVVQLASLVSLKRRDEVRDLIRELDRLARKFDLGDVWT